MRLWQIGLVLAVVVFGIGLVRTNGIPSPAPAIAQDGETCDVLAETVISSAQQACGGLAPGELCLGSDDVSVSMLDGGTAEFGAGELAGLATIRAITTAPADPAAGQWGLALASLPAGLPDAGVTAVLFGDAQLAQPEQTQAQRATLPVANRGAAEVNLRNGAGITYEVVGQLAAGEEVVADGRNEQADWLRIQYPDGLAWVFTPLVNWEGDLSTLEVLPPNDITPVFSGGEPFQALTLATREPTCAGAPSGLLLQHSGTETASIQINQVTLEFSDATMLVNAVPGDALEVKVLAGTGTVTARGMTLEAEVGSGVRVSLGGSDGLTPATAPVALQTYTFPDVAYAPLDLLPDQIACMAGVPAQTSKVQLRVGPGENRGVLAALTANASYPVLGWANDPQGSAWWELDTGAQTSWAAQSEVRAIGACSQVSEVEPPPLVFAAPAPVAPSGDAGAATTDDLAPDANSVWQMVPGSDNMSGECSGAPAINFCDHLAAIAPAGGGVSWKGMEPSPYPLTRIRPNVYAYAGPNVNGTGTVNMTLSFTSETTLKMTMRLVLSSEPNCQHVYYYTGTRNW